MRNLYGIDVSKTHLDLYGLALNGKTIRKRIGNNLKAIEAFLLSLDPGAVLCAEFTGIYSDLLAFTCHQLSIDIALISGYTLKHSMGNEKGKSDEVDAWRIYEYGKRFSDRLTLHQPDNEVLCSHLHKCMYWLQFQFQYDLTDQFYVMVNTKV